VTVHLFLTHPELEEGALAKRRASVVSTVALAEVARGIDLGAHLRLGRGEDQTGGRDKDSILADTMEAVIGATFLSAGPDAATALVLRLVEPLMADPDRYGAAMDPKTSLQELAARLGLAPPAYVSRPKARSQSRVHRDGERRRRDGDGSGLQQEAGGDGCGSDAWRTLSDRA
jgi:ribonuclease-3